MVGCMRKIDFNITRILKRKTIREKAGKWSDLMLELLIQKWLTANGEMGKRNKTMLLFVCYFIY